MIITIAIGESNLSNYTEEVTAYIVQRYVETPSRDTVESLADELQKSIKSIIGKLSREGVYVRENYKTKAGLDPITKLELVTDISIGLKIPLERLQGLEKAPKAVLQELVKSLT